MGREFGQEWSPPERGAPTHSQCPSISESTRSHNSAKHRQCRIRKLQIHERSKHDEGSKKGVRNHQRCRSVVLAIHLSRKSPCQLSHESSRFSARQICRCRFSKDGSTMIRMRPSLIGPYHQFPMNTPPQVHSSRLNKKEDFRKTNLTKKKEGKIISSSKKE